MTRDWDPCPTRRMDTVTPPRQRNEHPGRSLPNSSHTCKARQDARVPSTKKYCPPHLTDTARLALAQGSRGWAHVADSTLRAREERESRHQPSRLDTSRRDRLEVNMFKMGWRSVLSSGLTDRICGLPPILVCRVDACVPAACLRCVREVARQLASPPGCAPRWRATRPLTERRQSAAPRQRRVQAEETFAPLLLQEGVP